jgi:hypothetical protein
MPINIGNKIKVPESQRNSFILGITFANSQDIHSFKQDDPDEMYDLELILPWLESVMQSTRKCNDLECIAEVAGIDLNNINQWDTFVDYWQTIPEDDEIPDELIRYDLSFIDEAGDQYVCSYTQ